MLKEPRNPTLEDDKKGRGGDSVQLHPRLYIVPIQGVRAYMRDIYIVHTIHIYAVYMHAINAISIRCAWMYACWYIYTVNKLYICSICVYYICSIYALYAYICTYTLIYIYTLIQTHRQYLYTIHVSF